MDQSNVIMVTFDSACHAYEWAMKTKIPEYKSECVDNIGTVLNMLIGYYLPEDDGDDYEISAYEDIKGLVLTDDYTNAEWREELERTYKYLDVESSVIWTDEQGGIDLDNLKQVLEIFGKVLKAMFPEHNDLLQRILTAVK